jgi:hypothetical protein
MARHIKDKRSFLESKYCNRYFVGTCITSLYISFATRLLAQSGTMSRSPSHHPLTSHHQTPLFHENVALIKWHIDCALNINYRHRGKPEAAGRAKVIDTQLNTRKRVEISNLQGVQHCSDSLLFTNNIDTNLLPNILALVSSANGQRALYFALIALAPDLLSLRQPVVCVDQSQLSGKKRGRDSASL